MSGHGHCEMKWKGSEWKHWGKWKVVRVGCAGFPPLQLVSWAVSQRIIFMYVCLCFNSSMLLLWAEPIKLRALPIALHYCHGRERMWGIKYKAPRSWVLSWLTSSYDWHLENENEMGMCIFEWLLDDHQSCLTDHIIMIIIITQHWNMNTISSSSSSSSDSNIAFQFHSSSSSSPNQQIPIR